MVTVRPSPPAGRPPKPLARLGFAALLLAVVPMVSLAQDGEMPEGAPAAATPTESSRALEKINAYRAAAGVPPMAIHPALAEATAGHVRYYESNAHTGTLVGMGLHEQQPEAPGFTGAEMDDRARAAGYDGGTVTENAGFGQLDGAVEWYIHTVNHRLPLLHPSALDIGMARSEATGFGVIDVGLRRDRLEIDLPSVYPAPGATAVPTTWDGAETPDPAPGVARPLGYPLTVAFARYQQVELTALGLRDAAGAEVEISTPRTAWMRAAAIVPHRPLAPGTAYTARVEAVVDGAPVTKEWTFTTAE